MSSIDPRDFPEGFVIPTDPIQEAAQILANAQNILFITGAGLSADSGLAIFRGPGGLYENGCIEGVPIGEALSGPYFRQDPSLLWRWFAPSGRNMSSGRPNRGHEVITLFEQHRERVWVLTQNVDGFHTAAGSKNVIEIHGNMHRLLCVSCSYTVTVEDYSGLEIPPKCPDCAGVVRPNIVLFGENLPVDATEARERELQQGFEVLMYVGTTALFPYIFDPILEARRQEEVRTIEINPTDTQFTRFFDVKIALGAAEALDAIWDILSEQQSS